MNYPYQPGQTIAAIATPPGEGGIAIIRVSGKQAFAVVSKICAADISKLESHKAKLAKIFNADGQIIDQVLLLPFFGKNSFTGEDTVEIQCHGGGLITRKILQLILQNGARAALPGEFSFKAYINGKMDLAQAEAVQTLISAKSEKALSAATSHLEGALSAKISYFQTGLTKIAAILEAWVDFPEEGLEFASIEEVTLKLQKICEEMQELIKTFEAGKIIHDGVALCLIGPPNAGKSSLMNALLNKERAIVSDLPGTTRDVIDDFINISGMSCKLSDTAGIRETAELIESEGIKRSRQISNQADLNLLILDATEEISSDTLKLIDEIDKQKTILVWNKVDLPQLKIKNFRFKYVVDISAKDQRGLPELLKTIETAVFGLGDIGKEEIILTSLRHKQALQLALEALYRLIEGLKTEVSPEFLSFETRTALLELGKIIGRDVGEDIISAIFAQFCIGK